ncbi:MAG: hypothetical protein IJS28_05070 [Synergistaceae bacterium]|nr:hypothetical protein [Synergistaceae bacterium]
MAINSAEILANNISQRIEQLLTERRNLRSEFRRKSVGSLEQDKAFIQAFQNSIIDRAYCAVMTAKLEQLLLLR